MGSNEADWVVGNQWNNYISAGQGADFLYGKEGSDVYIIRQGDGLNTIFQNFNGDGNMDTILFDAKYDDIELFREELSFGIRAHKSDEERYLAASLSCLMYEEQESENKYHITTVLKNCFSLNQLYYIRTSDGVVFVLPTSEESPMVKTPLFLDASKAGKKLTPEFTQELVQVKRFIGSKFNDVILGNSLKNYIDPGIGGCYIQGGNGSDTYVIRSNHGIDNGIDNHAFDLNLDILLFLVPFASISSEVNNSVAENTVVLTSTGASSNVSVSLYEYGSSDANRHLMVVTEDGITFVLPPDNNYVPRPLIINKSQMRAGQYINLTASPAFSAVKTVYAAGENQNHIVGNKLDNTIVGGSRDDLLEGLDGKDVLKGGAGNDMLHGGAGLDTLVGGAGNDTLMGDDGDDIIAPGLGHNVVYGGNGTDTVIYTGESVGIEAVLPDNEIHHPHDEVVDIVHEVENVFGTEHDDILQGDKETNVLIGNGGDDQLFTGKSGYDILNGGNGSDAYGWIPAVKSFTSAITATMIINNYASDGKIDTIHHDITIHLSKELGFEKSRNDLVVRQISKKYPVFYDNGPVIFLKDWFHPKEQALYRHIQMQLAEEMLDSKKMEALGDAAAEREQKNKSI
jgi:Ca2+-binding RTX toxin-like protein